MSSEVAGWMVGDTAVWRVSSLEAMVMFLSASLGFERGSVGIG